MKIQPLLERLANTIKTYVDRRVGEIDAYVKSMPVPKDGKDGRDGIDGKDGRTPTIEEIKALIPEVKDGRDGVDGHTPTVDEIKALIPAPIPGKDADPVDISSVVAEVLKQVPAPKDGKDADPVDISVIAAEVLKHIPTPTNGKDAGPPSDEHLTKLIQPLIPKAKDGRDGKDGTDGRDGLDISPIPAIDEAKSYPRGTYATHKGGLWRSFEQTKAMKGWECLVNGFNGFEEEQVDERTFVVRCFTSTGVIETTRKVASIVYRELWVKGIEYELGDAVTWGGSIWIAKKHDGEYKQPGTEGSGWRLAVRAGRDGDRS